MNENKARRIAATGLFSGMALIFFAHLCGEALPVIPAGLIGGISGLAVGRWVMRRARAISREEE